MRIVEAYKANNAVEAHCVAQLLDEAGIECQITGGNLETMYGIGTSWTMPSIFVAEGDVQRAHEVISAQMATFAGDPQPKRPFRYGMKTLLINFTLAAIVLGLYTAMGQYWSEFAYCALVGIFVGNLMAYGYAYKKRQQLADEHGEDS